MEGDVISEEINDIEELGEIITKELKFFYTNADQFVNKRDDLLARIADDEPDVILITEVIPKCQSNPIAPALLNLEGYKSEELLFTQKSH